MAAMKRLLFLLALLPPAGLAQAEDIILLSTRPGVTQPYLISAPASGTPRAVAILFPGGAGNVDLEYESARAVLDRGNFLVRSRRILAAAGVAAVVIDAPSDRPNGMDDAFRLGWEHAEDIARVTVDLKKRFPGAPLFLVGTSRGTVSAASVGRHIGTRVDGVVLTATLFRATQTQQGLSGFDFATIKLPLLFVHHVNDGCFVTPYAAVKESAGSYPLISVYGGPPPQSKPCEAMSQHGFLGRETETVDAIIRWMLKRPYPAEIK